MATPETAIVGSATCRIYRGRDTTTASIRLLLSHKVRACQVRCQLFADPVQVALGRPNRLDAPSRPDDSEAFLNAGTPGGKRCGLPSSLTVDLARKFNFISPAEVPK